MVYYEDYEKKERQKSKVKEELKVQRAKSLESISDIEISSVEACKIIACRPTRNCIDTLITDPNIAVKAKEIIKDLEKRLYNQKFSLSPQVVLGVSIYLADSSKIRIKAAEIVGISETSITNAINKLKLKKPGEPCYKMRQRYLSGLKLE